ncbi:hypothetical protein [Nocardioides sp. WS12]|uniref:glycosyltransferase n=1 Tax=Nocardioides sp. WS12 TaxID=2486272 RepID=UPI0015FE7B6B|nr:hypothetical protein [Nocardioides sp. WS12]
MSAVVLFVGTRHEPRFLADVVRQFEDRGAQLTLVSVPTVDVPVGAGTEVRFINEASEGNPPAFWRRSIVVIPPRRMWFEIERDAWTVERALSADLLVAVDNRAVFAVWRLAQRNRRAAARAGVYAGLQALDKLNSPSEPPAAEAAAPTAAAVAVPQPDGPSLMVRGRRKARRVAGKLRRAARATRRPEVPDPAVEETRVRADELGTVAFAELAAAKVPTNLVDAVAAELAHADRLLAAGETRNALGSFLTATRLAFYPGIHFDSLVSPLAADPSGFNAALQDSEVLRRLATPAGRRHPAAAIGADRPARVVIMSSGNTNFVGAITARLEREQGAEVRTIGPAELGIQGGLNPVFQSLLNGDGRAEEMAEERLREHYDWADVVLIEWCTPTAVFATLIDPGTARVVVRLHSFEAWSLSPHLVDFSRVDEVVFVSEHLRELSQAAVPALAEHPAVSVVPNVVDLTGFDQPKDDDARFTLALIGISAVAKDVRWAIEVVRRLQAHDERYRLLLFGADLDNTGSAIGRAYDAAYRADLRELEPRGVVERRGYTSDVPGALRSVGVILSTSVRESAHLVVVEGAASGAVPVVRDWPFFAQQEHGARTFYPEHWVVGSVEEAVARVLATTATAEQWQAESAAARDAARPWDVTATGPAFDAALFGK